MGVAAKPAPGAGRAGFTLLEVIVVLLIIGILLGAIGFAIGTRERQLDEEGERLAALLRLAQQETILTASETAAGFHAEGYRFYQRQGDQWLLLTDGILRPRRLPHDFHLELRFPEIDQAPPPLPWLENDQDDRLLPRIHFLSGGEITPFELRLSVDSVQRPLILRGNLQGEIKIGE